MNEKKRRDKREMSKGRSKIRKERRKRRNVKMDVDVLHLESLCERRTECHIALKRRQTSHERRTL